MESHGFELHQLLFYPVTYHRSENFLLGHNASSHDGNPSDSTASAVQNETHGGNHSDSMASAVHNETHSVPEEVHHDASNASISLPSEVSHDSSSNLPDQKGKNNSLGDAETNMAHLNNSIMSSENEKISNLENGTITGRRLLEDDVSKRSVEDVQGATVENEEGLEADADSSFELFRDGDELADEYNYDYDDYVDENGWDDEESTQLKHEKVEDYVDVDAHVLCTPVSLLQGHNIDTYKILIVLNS